MQFDQHHAQALAQTVGAIEGVGQAVLEDPGIGHVADIGMAAIQYRVGVGVEIDEGDQPHQRIGAAVQSRIGASVEGHAGHQPQPGAGAVIHRKPGLLPVLAG